MKTVKCIRCGKDMYADIYICVNCGSSQRIHKNPNYTWNDIRAIKLGPDKNFAIKIDGNVVLENVTLQEVLDELETIHDPKNTTWLIEEWGLDKYHNGKWNTICVSSEVF